MRRNGSTRGTLRWVAAIALAMTMMASSGARSTTGERSLSFYNTHTAETLSVTYYAGGAYVEASSMLKNEISCT